MSKFEYWCVCGNHWAKESKIVPPEGYICCKECSDNVIWDLCKPIVREIKEPRFVPKQVSTTGIWSVWDIKRLLSVDSYLTETQVKEIAALRNKWNEETNG